MTASLRTLCILLVVLGGCGTTATMPDASTTDASPDTSIPDAGEPDLGTPDMGIVYPPGSTCGDPMAVTGAATGMTSASFDTTTAPPGMRDFGLLCGSPDPMMGAGRWPPQEVVAYTVGGTGMQRIDFTTVNSATAMGFDTVVQVRETCEMVPPDSLPFSCFDDSGTDRRSTGSYSAMSGSTLYFFITGYTLDMPMAGATDRGRGRIDFTQHAAQAPVETMAQAIFVGGRFELDTAGMDADGDAVGAVASFLDAMGAPVADFDGNPLNGLDVVPLPYEPSVAGMTTFSGAGDVPELLAAGMTAQSVLTAAGATQAVVQIYDQGGLRSAPMTVPIITIPEVEVGDACDAGHRCRLVATCSATSMTCELPPAIDTACMAAVVLPVATPTTATTTATVAGMIPTGTGQFNGSCGANGGVTSAGATAGPEVLYNVVVPAGHFDLIAGTDTTMAPTTDTVVYVRSSCGEINSEVGCNDDRASGDLRSTVEIQNVAPGTYTIFVEHWNDGGPVSFRVHADLRPVLDPGATCNGRTDRCSGGDCPASHVCP